MIFVNKDRFSFTHVTEEPDKTWMERLGIYGSPLGFTEVATFPSRIISRLEFRLSSYQSCNLKCDYCFERYAIEHFMKISPDQIVFDQQLMRDKLLEYKPSAIELVGGERLQQSFMANYQAIINLLDELDPYKKIRVEQFTNGKDIDAAVKVYQDTRMYITISIAPNDDYRHVDTLRVLETAKRLASIDRRRVTICVMLSTHSTLQGLISLFKTIKSYNINYFVQPVNETSTFKNDEDFNLDFFENIFLKVPELLDSYKVNSLIYPHLSCYDGNLCICGQNYSSCTFGDQRNQEPTYLERLGECGATLVTAGVVHVCTKLNKMGIPTNMDPISRMGYTAIAHQLANDPYGWHKCDHLISMYRTMISYKRAILPWLFRKHDGVTIDALQPHRSISYMDAIRISDEHGIHQGQVIDHTGILSNDQWFIDDCGKTLDVYYTDELPENKDIVAITRNNFPARLIFCGNSSDIKELTSKRPMPNLMVDTNV
jgi:hypothetical protein